MHVTHSSSTPLETESTVPHSMKGERADTLEVAGHRLSLSEGTEVLGYLHKARFKAQSVREHTPSGSYVDNVLAGTIAGIDKEISQLRYLLRLEPEALHPSRLRTVQNPRSRMRPAL